MQSGRRQTGKPTAERDRQAAPPPSPSGSSSIGLLAALVAPVCILVLLAHWPTLRATALSFDDQQYLIESRLVQNPSWHSAGHFLGEMRAPSIIGFTNVIGSDKYAQWPAVSLLLVLASLLACLWNRPAKQLSAGLCRLAVLAVVLILCAAETVATRRQIARWADTETLFRHMLELAPNVVSIHDALGPF